MENLKWSEYIDPNYGYRIEYPSNVGIGKPLSMGEFNPSLTGNLFLLDNTSVELKDAAALTIDAFHKNEKLKLKNSLILAYLRRCPKTLILILLSLQRIKS